MSEFLDEIVEAMSDFGAFVVRVSFAAIALFPWVITTDMVFDLFIFRAMLPLEGSEVSIVGQTVLWMPLIIGSAIAWYSGGQIQIYLSALVRVIRREFDAKVSPRNILMVSIISARLWVFYFPA